MKITGEGGKIVRDQDGKLHITLDASSLPRKKEENLIRELELSIAIDEARIKLIGERKDLKDKEAEKWLYSWYAIKNDKEKVAKWKEEIGSLEELVKITRKAEREGERKAKERIKKLKPAYPEFPIAKIDRTTSDELLPLFLTKGIFSNFNKIPHIQDLADEEAKKIKRKLTAKERKDLEVKTKEYKKDGYVWKEFPQYAIGFSYMQFTEYLEKVESEYQEKKGEAELKPFLFPDMKREIEEVLRKVRLYKKGQSLTYGILGEAFLQKKFFEVELLKKNAVYYIGKTPQQKAAYQQVKEILNSLRWLSYKVIGREGAKIKGAIGNFIFNIEEKGNEYILDINPKYVGCIKYFIEDKELHTKQKRKELFNRGYFNFPMKALVISGDYSIATEEFRNYLLREKGNKHLNTKKYKVISQKVKVYIGKAHLGYKQRSKNYKVFLNEILPTLIRDKFISKIEPSLNKLKALPPKRAYESNLKLYIPHIKELEKNLGELLEKRREIAIKS